MIKMTDFQNIKNKTKSFIHSSRWVIAFFLLCLILFERGMKNKAAHYERLLEQKIKLERDKEIAISRMHHLQLQINSQSDPKWIELTLKKEMGLVPVGERKVYFFKEEN